MSADEFLALVEKHSLPWRLEMLGEPVAYILPGAEGWHDGERGVCLGHENAMTQALADAAPSLVAAAIRLLRAAASAASDGYPTGLEQSCDALRAALPPSLRS